eukprot:tig00020553_g10585.t1
MSSNLPAPRWITTPNLSDVRHNPQCVSSSLAIPCAEQAPAPSPAPRPGRAALRVPFRTDRSRCSKPSLAPEVPGWAHHYAFGWGPTTKAPPNHFPVKVVRGDAHAYVENIRFTHAKIKRRSTSSRPVPPVHPQYTRCVPGLPLALRSP